MEPNLPETLCLTGGQPFQHFGRMANRRVISDQLDEANLEA